MGMATGFKTGDPKMIVFPCALQAGIYSISTFFFFEIAVKLAILQILPIREQTKIILLEIISEQGKQNSAKTPEIKFSQDKLFYRYTVRRTEHSCIQLDWLRSR